RAAIGSYSCLSLGPGWRFPTGTRRSPRNTDGERSVCKQHRFLPCQLQHAALYCSAACLPSKIEHTAHSKSTHSTQLTL
ncbi:unnamed protein product, partial [Staurois parvus]